MTTNDADSPPSRTATAYDGSTDDDHAPCGLVTMTLDGVIIRCNRAFHELAGRGADELLGRTRFFGLLTRGGQIHYETSWGPALRLHGRVTELACELMHPTRGKVLILLNAAVQVDEAGSPVVVHVAVFEAAQRRHYEQELVAQTKRLAASEARARALSATLQRTLLPPVLPHVEGLDLGACYRPAGDGSDVGGDFYDIFQTGDQSWVVVVGDVCGKGVEAAVLTALSRYSLRAAAMQQPSPAYALGVLNSVLLADGSDRHATVAYLRLDRQGDRWRVRSAFAGHPLALLRHRDGEVTTFGEAGQAVGLFADIETQEAEHVLEPGQSLLLHTDGVTEARRGADFFGEQRLAHLLRPSLPSAQARADVMLREVLAFQGPIGSDDIACVIVHLPELRPSGTT